ncbi:MAG: alpha/beta hydrolase-fold protein [Eubacteriales bacterium]|jgi:enterochelin esterase-like enzyme
MKRNNLAVILLLAALVCLIIFLAMRRNHEEENTDMTADLSANLSADLSVQSSSAAVSEEAVSEDDAGHLETVHYSISYEGTAYDKEASVYVPSSYNESEPMNILYLMHGSQGSGEQLAAAMQPLFDDWIREGTMQPMLVVFPTYYPDRSFVVSNYSEDYPLNHFFATSEVRELMKAAEGQYHTYADSTDDEGFKESRMHRAFGGYSMGGVTTWDVLASQADYFSYFMPMAGDCWLDRISDEPVDQLLAQGLEDGGYTSGDFRIIAMVGGSDGTKASMQPQIAELRENHQDLITDENLIYWENEGGGHSQESLELEVEHGVQYLWTLS